MSISERMQSFMFEVETPDGEITVFEGEPEEKGPKDPSEMTALEREEKRSELLGKIKMGKVAEMAVAEIDSSEQ